MLVWKRNNLFTRFSTVADAKTGKKKELSPIIQELRKNKKPSPIYYAVRKGREIGVFAGWENTKGKVLGFPDAHFKTFRSQNRAREWLELKDWTLYDKIKSESLEKIREIQARTMKPSIYQLNIAAVECKTENERKGSFGMGWVLRKKPELELIVAGCDLFDKNEWKTKIKVAPGFEPLLNPEYPRLETLNFALREISDYFGFSQDQNEKNKLAFPLVVKSENVYTVGLLNGSNPNVPDLVPLLEEAKSRISNLSVDFECIQALPEQNVYAEILARAAFSRKHPRYVLKPDSSQVVVDAKQLIEMLSDCPDVPKNITPIYPPKFQKARKKTASSSTQFSKIDSD